MIPRKIKSSGHSIEVPGDKSLSHRAVLFSALAKGKSRVVGFLEAEDPMNTMHAFSELGLKVEKIGQAEYVFTSPGKSGLISPTKDLDFGNAGTGIRLSAGLLCGLPQINATLTGDDSLKKRPMARILDPLNSMGASIQGIGEKKTAPLLIHGKQLHSFAYKSPIASAQVKSCLMLAAMSSEVSLDYEEEILSRDHTENVFRFMGNQLQYKTPTRFLMEPPYKFEGADFKIPGDISSAAFFLVLGLLLKQGSILVKNVGLNPSRTGILKALAAMGGEIRIHNQRIECGEIVGDLEAVSSELSYAEIPPDWIPALIDEIPILTIAGLFAKGGFRIRNAEELRAKESDRIASMVENLRSLGVEVWEYHDGYEFGEIQMTAKSSSLNSWLSGRSPRILTKMDHRIAMSFLVLQAVTGLALRIDNTSWIDTSFPGFQSLLESVLQ
ncbi:3-phosphoshikimate 1-carboxyvinyltransferase [Leptospira perolatii]|uniref:3-phosphoshikimate 1-carboxyvinyltransferase n=1 Tax=Leptospira perolatii TaxID=2023191 RepID=A0A2M9ZNE5_9LEPT|nr:3-phosphoshikimate 1-carboxyvinyltransferase [Leptospira perolatii]PJZ68675.1 3-phosphoshikimate 1-carboxyvinyltransferase [Leptospira perolatii]PJZ73511.1 3-phosphoshikimate 1-carboxyvinyltransferase [Leptospira perolatii]